MVTSTSAFNTNLSQTSSFGNRNSLRDASFSSYLKHTEENFFLLKLTGSNQNPSSFISTPEEHLFVGRKKVKDDEIGVFGAEKYFKGTMDGENPRISGRGSTKDKSIDKSPDKPKTQPATPSVHSKSSWNSESVLLYSFPRNQMQRKPNKGNGKRFLANFRCRCYCTGKKSVEVDTGNIGDNCGEIGGKRISKQPVKTEDLVRPNKSLSKTCAEEETNMHPEKIHETSKREECFSFPVLNSKAEDTSVKVKLNEEDNTGNSLEVFGSPILEKGDKSFSLERKLTMLNWGSKGNEIPPNGTYNDMESDASSDLFEIESFSTNPNCYAPSEASIEWSVVTESAADFSIMTDSEESRTAESGSKVRGRMERSRRSPTRPGILLGCKSQKSVRVAGDVHRTTEKATRDPQIGIVQTEYKVSTGEQGHGV